MNSMELKILTIKEREYKIIDKEKADESQDYRYYHSCHYLNLIHFFWLIAGLLLIRVL